MSFTSGSLNKIDYSQNASMNMQRSGFNLSHKGLTTMNAGKLVPVRAIPIVPGQTISVDISAVVRSLSPMLKPTMDDLHIELAAFKCYDSQVWDNAHAFYTGRKTQDPNEDYNPTVALQQPQLTPPAGGWNKDSIMAYLNVPQYKNTGNVSALPSRHVANVFNNYYRAQSFQGSFIIPKTDTTVAGSNGNDYANDVHKGGEVPYVNREHNLFTSCLPKPQKGNAISIQLTGDIPVYTKGATHPKEDSSTLTFLNAFSNTVPTTNRALAVQYSGGSSGLVDYTSTTPSGFGNGLTPNNLWADTSGLTLLDINTIRKAATQQQVLEKMARFGTRPEEYYRAFYGIDVPSLELQIPEYLGGIKVDIQTEQVVATNAAATNSPLGNIGGISHTSFNGGGFTTSSTQFGYILIFAYIRHEDTFQQGLERHWFRKEKDDHLIADYAHWGEQPIYNKEIYVSGNATTDNAIFGYNEQFIHYKDMQNFITGEVNSAYSLALDQYHYGTEFSATPVLNDAFMRFDRTVIDRTISQASTGANAVHQFIASLYFNIKSYLPIPQSTGIPGIDRL